ncbi:MAG: EF2563 family selenium-dependent molybdenum hydroxylase system protein [Anaerolineales bacterium]|nr:EF2563 family selenium-dependent molybdenum hydroxylase system protein [Anaerolineales bacterium]
MSKNNFVLIRGGGDLATGVALRLYRAGIKVLITELARPLAVRRTVSFAEAVYTGHHTVEGVKARLIEANQLSAWDEADEIPVLVDPNIDILLRNTFYAVVDARLIKQVPPPLPKDVSLHIGLGPGFCAGENCHAVIETRRSHTLGRVYWQGSTQPDSGLPEGDPRRVLRAPSDGVVVSHANIGDHVKDGQVIAEIQSEIEDRKSKIVSPFDGVLRGLIHNGLYVPKGLKVGDIDPRGDASVCDLVSDKALAIGGGVLEAVLSKEEIRKLLYAVK